MPIPRPGTCASSCTAQYSKVTALAECVCAPSAGDAEAVAQRLTIMIASADQDAEGAAKLYTEADAELHAEADDTQDVSSGAESDDDSVRTVTKSGQQEEDDLIDVTKSVLSGSSSDSSQNKRKRPLEEPSDSSLVHEVRSYMNTNKLSQVMVGQEARVSQAVISQWLSLKYRGHNSKVRAVMLLLLSVFCYRRSAWTRSQLRHAPFR